MACRQALARESSGLCPFFLLFKQQRFGNQGGTFEARFRKYIPRLLRDTGIGSPVDYQAGLSSRGEARDISGIVWGG